MWLMYNSNKYRDIEYLYIKMNFHAQYYSSRPHSAHCRVTIPSMDYLNGYLNLNLINYWKLIIKPAQEFLIEYGGYKFTRMEF